MAHTFEDLVNLERLAEEAHARYTAPGVDDLDAARRAWVEAATAVQAAITEHAKAEGTSRYDVEMAVKKTVRHPGADGD
ncbi:hypothetical protein [Streptomyces lancefieldiae]|uniref:Uncharacterized protein n=1 Tax=Streptomyces lancefieldiae TaxID=3075520 RepID=A0ABU3AFG2_9ACTN|nr:hypothetical protein [Streptomyces sp. DSM 40712]MDT0608914.1 hypothetical protein [Streptomyces sp. DSM 40712]